MKKLRFHRSHDTMNASHLCGMYALNCSYVLHGLKTLLLLSKFNLINIQ